MCTECYFQVQTEDQDKEVRGCEDEARSKDDARSEERSDKLLVIVEIARSYWQLQENAACGWSPHYFSMLC